MKHCNAKGWRVLLISLAPIAATGDLTIAVQDADLPVGGSTIVQILLDPSVGPVAAIGGTVVYDPGALEVSYVGVGPSALGGPTQAVHLVAHEPGRIVFGGALPSAVSHAPTEPEPFLRMHLTRRLGTATQVSLNDPFYLPSGSLIFQPVSPSNVVFAVISGDSDGDGILDTWEFFYFDGLSIATDVSDYDGDGISDADESLAGTHPRIPYLTTLPLVDGFNRATPFRVAVTITTETQVAYHVEQADFLAAERWDEIFFAVSPGGSAVHDTVIGTGSDQTLEIPVWGVGPHFFRITVHTQ